MSDGAAQAITGTKTITVTPVADSPVVSGTIDVSSVSEDGLKLITESQLLDPNKVSDADTQLSDLSIGNLQVATSGAGTIEAAYASVANGAQAPSSVAGLTSVSSDVAWASGSPQSTYALFKDEDANSSTVGKLFVYTTTTWQGTTNYSQGIEVEVSGEAWAYRPAQDFNGDVQLTYDISDGTSTPANATASLTVTPVNDAPTVTVPATVSATEDQAKFIDGISISDVDTDDANDVLQVTLSVSGGTLRVDGQESATVTLTGTKDYINGELAGAGRFYREDYSFDGKTPDEDGYAGGTLTPISGLGSHKEVSQDYIYKATTQGQTKYYVRTEYEAPDSQYGGNNTYEVSTYREVEGTQINQNETVWSFKAGGDTKTFDGNTQSGMGVHLQSGTFEMVVAITHDGTGQYWAQESVTQEYRALELEGLAVYEKDDANGNPVRYEHDTVLNTLQALKTEYVMTTPPQGFSPPQTTDWLSGKTPVATGVTVDVSGTNTQVDIYSYNFTANNVSQDILLAYDTSGQVSVYKAAIFADEVADGTAQSVASDYDPAADTNESYTKVSGLFYTADGDQTSDAVSIQVKDEWNNSLASDSVSITVTGVNDAPTIVSPSTSTLSVAEGTTSITTVQATDPEGDTITYSITGGADSDLFEIDTTTGELSFKSAPDREDPKDAGTNNVYDVEVTATDNGDPNKTDVQSIAVTVTNTNDAPTATNLDAAQTTDEDIALDLTDIVITDPDGDTMTATLTLDDMTAGTLTAGTFGSVTPTYTPTAGKGVWTATGSVADVNAALAAVKFAPATNFSCLLYTSPSPRD